MEEEKLYCRTTKEHGFLNAGVAITISWWVYQLHPQWYKLNN